MNHEITYSVTDFVAVCNQVLEFSFEGRVSVLGEVANFRISKNKWVYFDLKDENATLRVFGTVYHIPSPLEDGMLIVVNGNPVLHSKYGFSINIQSIKLHGEGTIKKSAKILELKLAKEGIFDEKRKRKLGKYPKKIGIVSSSQSAGYADFIKITNERWVGVNIKLFDVLVQGDEAPSQIISAINYFNQTLPDLDSIVIIRGGGSSEDLQAFNHEAVVRSVAASRIPTLIAVGHETDLSLAEKAADLRASTPSNAAQLLLPDKKEELKKMIIINTNLNNSIKLILINAKVLLNSNTKELNSYFKLIVKKAQENLKYIDQKLELLNPETLLKKGFIIARQKNKVVAKIANLDLAADLELQFTDGRIKLKNLDLKRSNNGKI